MYLLGEAPVAFIIPAIIFKWLARAALSFFCLQIRAALQNPEHNALQQLGDYLMLYLLAKNLNPLILKVCYR